MGRAAFSARLLDPARPISPAVNPMRVLHLLRTRGPLSRADIARQTNLTKATASRIIAELVSRNLAREAGVGRLSRGRRPILYEFNTISAIALGIEVRQQTCRAIVTELDASSGAAFARNPYNTEFAGRVAFFDVDETTRTISGDRTEFIGRNGTLRNPAAMARVRLSGKVGAGLDPCGAIHVPFELAAGQEREIIFRLGVDERH